jgi:hypothetical protein
MSDINKWWNEKSTNQKILWLLVFLILGLLATYSGISQILLHESSKDWPSVEGQVINSHVTFMPDWQDPAWRVRVSYDYSVNGISYSSSKSGSYASERSARGAGARYPQGSTVLVFYDPSSPSRAVLEGGGPSGSLPPVFILVMGVVFTLGSFIDLCRLIRKANNSSQSR